MCGRFTLFATPVEVADLFGTPPFPDLPPRYNIAPTQPVLACRAGDGSRELVRPRWGLVPRWASDLKAGAKAVNARAETVASLPTFREAFSKRRCLIPASGYFEWKKEGSTKQPFLIQPASGTLFAFAGLWDVWAKGGEPVETCTLITTAANDALRHLHERMPVILSKESFAAWLAPTTPAAALPELLRPCPADLVAFHPVSPRVGNVRNDDADLVEPTSSVAVQP
jgi:putative SOS response-associated peptidase YedK